MPLRQLTGSVVCPSCGRLAGVNDARCFSCGRWNPGLWGWAPVVNRFGRDLGMLPLVMGGCGLLYLATLLYDPSQLMGGGLFSFLAPTRKALFVFGMSGSIPVFGFDRWWSVLSAGWLHGGLLHIVFNMMALRQLIPVTAELFGVGRMVILYTFASVMGFLVTSVVGLLPLPGILHGAQFTVGASAALFGLFGALLRYGQRTGRHVLTRDGIVSLIVWVVLGFFIGFIDNWAHLGGFAGGYLAAIWLDPLREESQGHYLGALVCLGATVVSIVISILHGLPLVAGS